MSGSTRLRVPISCQSVPIGTDWNSPLWPVCTARGLPPCATRRGTRSTRPRKASRCFCSAFVLPQACMVCAALTMESGELMRARGFTACPTKRAPAKGGQHQPRAASERSATFSILRTVQRSCAGLRGHAPAWRFRDANTQPEIGVLPAQFGRSARRFRRTVWRCFSASGWRRKTVCHEARGQRARLAPCSSPPMAGSLDRQGARISFNKSGCRSSTRSSFTSASGGLVLPFS